MKNWTEKHIKKLQREGRIPGYHAQEKRKGFSSDKTSHQSTRTRSKALDWLGWNLLYWSNQNSLTLVREHKFCPDRGWRFDFAFPSIHVAVEFEGGIFMEISGHNTAKHFNKDTEKYSRAAILGWRVLRYTALNYTTALKDLNELYGQPSSAG